MFSKLAILAPLAILAAATPVPTGDGPYGGDGPANLCCVSTQSASSTAGSILLGLVGVAVGDVTALVGGTCSPLTVSPTSKFIFSYLNAYHHFVIIAKVIGVGGTSCTNNPVTCQDYYCTLRGAVVFWFIS